MEERIENYGIIYKIMCFLFFRSKKKFTYKEMYLMFYELNRKKQGNDKAKEMAIKKIINIYKKEHNNELPKGL